VEFKRKKKRKKKRGVNQKTRRLWFSAEGYRIIWRKKVFGVTVPPGFQACVRTIAPGCFENGSTEMWDFVNRDRRLHKTMKAAIADCERHQQLWNQATKCVNIRAIQELFGHRPVGMPKWVATKLDRRVSAVLLDTQSGHEDEVEEESKAKSKASRKSSPRKPVTSEKKKRKTRNDKGKKRGPRKGTKNE